jgi:hypothetical protein
MGDTGMSSSTGSAGGLDIETARHSTSALLIAADKVEGTAVYNPLGERLGTIETFMLDKVNGKAAYAVLSFGGFLGIGTRHYPLPWSALKYDRNQGGYVVHLDKSVLEAAPSFEDGETVAWEDRAWGQRVHDYYKATPYWM